MQQNLTASETLITDSRDVTTSNKIRLSPDGNINIEGPAVIDTVLVRAQSESFRVRAETNETTLVDDDWSTLDTLSADLSHISTRTDGSARVLVIEDYPYTEFASVTIDPIGEVTFNRIRGVWITGIPVTY